jgi:hypothetical protein
MFHSLRRRSQWCIKVYLEAEIRVFRSREVYRCSRVNKSPGCLMYSRFTHAVVFPTSFSCLGCAQNSPACLTNRIDIVLTTRMMSAIIAGILDSSGPWGAQKKNIFIAANMRTGSLCSSERNTHLASPVFNPCRLTR